ncbi:MAG: ChaN family lipoprotein [Bacteroidales bacterium]|nr:ChaN family lipoprotein [Bacteroidales bacterium]
MKNLIILILAFSSVFTANAQELRNYRLYFADGKPASFNNILEQSHKSDVVLFGEYHNNAVSHWLQLMLTKELFTLKKENLILGAEMFEADGQLILDEYLAGFITEKNFIDQARLWKNYSTDYAPLVNFAKENNLKFIASNIPRHYAAMVAREGFEALNKLSDIAKTYIADLPIKYDANLDCYKAMLAMGGGMGRPANENLPKAQAIKDATMAQFIFKNISKNSLFLHFNGAYHSDNYESIYWYLKQLDKNLKILTITTIEQANIHKLEDEYLNRADFIIVVDENFTKTY